VFLHGYTGTRDDTWDRFPALLGTSTPDWDIFTVGYATTLLPDVVGIWSADPDLPILSKMVCTELRITPFARYQSLTLIAHSMGGLVGSKSSRRRPESRAKSWPRDPVWHAKRRTPQSSLVIFLEAATEKHGGRQQLHQRFAP